MKAAGSAHRSLGVDEAPLGERRGRGVAVAVLDSGLNPGNPHVTPADSAVTLHEEGGESDDAVDRLGHGTAVTAAIQEKAPEASIRVIRIFHETLSIDTPTLVRALDRAVEEGARLVNLSLGTPDPGRSEALRAAVARAIDRGAIVVSAREHRGRRWWPGALEGVAGVLLDWDCPRSRVRLMRGPSGKPVFRASGYPRPVPGVPVEQNLKGISFAVANTTGILARLLEGEPGLSSVEAVAEEIERLAEE